MKFKISWRTVFIFVIVFALLNFILSRVQAWLEFTDIINNVIYYSIGFIIAIIYGIWGKEPK